MVMENSILSSTKKVLGISAEYTYFDQDILTHLNSAFATLSQLGVDWGNGYVADDTIGWDDLVCPVEQLHMVKAYIYLKVRIAFDPPSTSFLIEALNQQIKEHEWRLNSFREVAIMEIIEVVP